MKTGFMVEIDADGTIYTKVRGNEFRITPIKTGVRVFVTNASSRAYMGGSSLGKDFPDLLAVEECYKSLRGIALLAAEPINTLPC